EAVNEENVSRHSNDPLISGEDRLKLEELMTLLHDLDGDEVFVETEEPMVNAATTTSTIPVSAAKDLSDVNMTLA
ncbi:hypothetical protein Tco_1171944, partial [Tanacetum coccineum]